MDTIYQGNIHINFANLHVAMLDCVNAIIMFKIQQFVAQYIAKTLSTTLP